MEEWINRLTSNRILGVTKENGNIVINREAYDDNGPYTQQLIIKCNGK